MSNNLENNLSSLDLTNMVEEEQTNTNQQPRQQAQEVDGGQQQIQAQPSTQPQLPVAGGEQERPTFGTLGTQS